MFYFHAMRRNNQWAKNLRQGKFLSFFLLEQNKRFPVNLRQGEIVCINKKVKNTQDENELAYSLDNIGTCIYLYYVIITK